MTATNWNRLTQTQAPASNILVRFLVGLVFFFEGIQKLIYPDILGAGRFTDIGIPWPDVIGPFVGVVETTCGLLLLTGLLTRLASIPLIITMIVAITSTKIPILLGSDLSIFNVAEDARFGFWGMEHAIRTDFAMLLGATYLAIVGAGRWSLDAAINTRPSS